jgi:nicotinate-nucleotide pyrophosphorylase (carboxylating)
MNFDFDARLNKLLNDAFSEDLGTAGDITTKSIFTEIYPAKAIIRSKENGILSGAKIIAPTFLHLDKKCGVSVLKKDGEMLENGSIIAEIEGDIHTILAGERTILNLLQRLCGIAAATQVLAKKIAHTNAKVIDTRKTTPTLRFLEKEAVIHGGGSNHRFGLFDMILIKDTHIAAAGGRPDKAVTLARENAKKLGISAKIEVEVQNLKEFDEALSANPDRIMLDNMNISDMKFAVSKRNSQKKSIELEASGGINQNSIVEIAETGIDFISVGALTHSVKSLDIHLKIL